MPWRVEVGLKIWRERMLEVSRYGERYQRKSGKIPVVRSIQRGVLKQAKRHVQ
jgi:hypothetical protein